MPGLIIGSAGAGTMKTKDRQTTLFGIFYCQACFRVGFVLHANQGTGIVYEVFVP